MKILVVVEMKRKDISKWSKEVKAEAIRLNGDIRRLIVRRNKQEEGVCHDFFGIQSNQKQNDLEFHPNSFLDFAKEWKAKVVGDLDLEKKYDLDFHCFAVDFDYDYCYYYYWSELQNE